VSSIEVNSKNNFPSIVSSKPLSSFEAKEMAASRTFSAPKFISSSVISPKMADRA
jgi:hypothetical protein